MALQSLIDMTVFKSQKRTEMGMERGFILKKEARKQFYLIGCFQHHEVGPGSCPGLAT